jgi:hypothetical protein
VAINEAVRLIDQEKIDIINGVYASSHAVPLAAKVEQQKKIPLDYDRGFDRRVQGQEPAIRLPRTDSFRSVRPGLCGLSSASTPRPSSEWSPRTSRSR